LNSLHPYLKISLFLLLSAGMHGGLAFYDWTTGTEESSLKSAPVLVSFLPVTEVTPPAPLQSTKPSIDQPPALQSPSPAQNKPPRVVPKPARPLTAAAPAKIRPQQVPPKKALPKKELPAVVHAELQAEPSTTQVVCMVPPEVASAGLPDVPENLAGTIEGKSAALAITEPDMLSVTTVLGATELTEAIPNHSSNPLPEYPFLARQKHWEGVVWLLVGVSKEGLVEDLSVEQSCGHSLLDRAASHAVRRWRFTPARRAGQPTASQVRIPVRFELEDS
jgi:protein TonB